LPEILIGAGHTFVYHLHQVKSKRYKVKLLPRLNKDYVMKAYVEMEVYHLASKWRTVVRFMLLSLHCWEKHPSGRKLCFPTEQFWSLWTVENSLSLERIQPRFPDLPAHSLVIIMDELHLLPQLLLIFIFTMSIFKFDRYSIKKNRSNLQRYIRFSLSSMYAILDIPRFVQYLLMYGMYSQPCIKYRLSYEALSHVSILDGHFTAHYNL
jgi:hypothetical protein